MSVHLNATGRRWSGLVAVLALVVSACSTGGGASSVPSAASLPAATAAPATTAPVTTPEPAASEVTIMTYFGADLGEKALAKLLERFTADTGVTVKMAPVGHEDFKTGILVQMAGNNPPDAHSNWAGARTAFQVKNGSLNPIDDIWAANNLDAAFPAGLVQSASMYEGKHYLVPLGYHYAGMFYNPAVFAKAGVAIPKTWDEFIVACDKLKAAGVTPIALGSKNRWPAQFWFDYLLLRTAGAEYRAKLMSGEASYTDDQVVKAMTLWQTLLEAGYFTKDANAYDWTDASDQVAKGEAAMTLMGTWITGYWNEQKKVPGTDYNFFEFPTVDPAVPNAVVGPVDGMVTAAQAKNPDGAKKLLLFLTDPGVQTEWAIGQGALAPNVKADTTKFNVVIQDALKVVGAAKSFNFNYDLATPPAVAEAGLDMFASFVGNPADITGLLGTTQTAAKAAFGR